MPPNTKAGALPRIEFLWFEDCPSHQTARAMLHDAIAELGLLAEIRDIKVETDEQAEALEFRGSPTIRINGLDIDPEGLDGGSSRLTCRAYRWTDGRIHPLPERSKLLDALRGMQVISEGPPMRGRS